MDIVKVYAIACLLACLGTLCLLACVVLRVEFGKRAAQDKPSTTEYRCSACLYSFECTSAGKEAYPCGGFKPYCKGKE